MKDESQLVIYFAVGAYTKRQRVQRDAERLKAAAKGTPIRSSESGPGVGVVDKGFSLIETRKLIGGIREIAHEDRNVSLILEGFEVGWPGKDPKGKPRDPRQSFRRWMKTREAKALFGTASAVTLYAIDLAFESNWD